jgi:hypothetical protein
MKMGEQVIDDREAFLFVGEGKISEDDLLELKVELEVDHLLPVGEYREAFGEVDVSSATDKNTFSIGDPIPLSLNTFLTNSGQSLLSDIQQRTGDYEFCPVQLTCSFAPARGYRFHAARFEIVLQVLPINSTSPSPLAQKPAIAYSLFPLRSEDQADNTTKIGGAVGVNLGNNPSSPSLNVPVYGKDSTFVSYASYIEAFGLQTTRPGWQFTRTRSHEISGPYALLMLVRKPKGTKVQATFSLTAHLQFLYGSTPLKTLLSLVMFFRRRGSSATITDPTVQLC